jgi:uncharacterized protein YndB with AHSA1/START domain
MDIRPSPPVFIQHNFVAKIETVFDAWINPDVVRRWMFASPTNKIEVIRMDPGPGGRFSILEWNGREHIDHFGEYLTVEEPHRLVFTLQVPKHFAGQSVVNVILAPLGNGTSMTFSQSGVDRDLTTAPWQTMFRGLNAVLSAPSVFAAAQARRPGHGLFPNTKVAKYDVQNLINLNPAGETPQRPGRHT